MALRQERYGLDEKLLWRRALHTARLAKISAGSDDSRDMVAKDDRLDL